jgi:hypothetical protein
MIDCWRFPAEGAMGRLPSINVKRKILAPKSHMSASDGFEPHRCPKSRATKQLAVNTAMGLRILIWSPSPPSFPRVRVLDHLLHGELLLHSAIATRVWAAYRASTATDLRVAITVSRPLGLLASRRSMRWRDWAWGHCKQLWSPRLWPGSVALAKTVGVDGPVMARNDSRAVGMHQG